MHYDFTTASVRPADKLNAWQAVVHDACVPMALQSKRVSRFYGDISSRDVDDICISMVTADGHVAKHDRPQIARTRGDFLLVSLQLAGEGILEQDGRSATTSADDLVVYDSDRPYRWSFQTGFKQLVLRIPRHHLQHRLDLAPRYTAQSVCCKTGMGKIASDYLASLFHQSALLETDNHRLLADSAVDMLTATISAHVRTPCGARTNIQSLHLKQACKLIAENIRNPDLNPEMIASALKISVRYLHQLFRSLDTSVGRHILHERIAGCARALTQPKFATTSVSAIAFSWGFNSAAHFSRAFRAEMGMTPRDYRASPADAFESPAKGQKPNPSP